MVRPFLFALILAACPVQLVAAPARPAAPVHKAPARDWSTIAVRSPSGTFVQGNPDARVKLVEYLSLTCPHCAHFEAEGIAPLTAKYIRTGLVSYEVRHALRDGFDFAGSLLARCEGPQAFFATLPKVFAQQESWFSRAQAWSRVEQADGMPPDQLLPKLATGAGFDTVFGLSAARMNACLTDHDEQTLLNTLAAQAWGIPNFPGTPTFQIDGQLLPDVRTWVDLDARLAARLKMPNPLRKTKRS